MADFAKGALIQWVPARGENNEGSPNLDAQTPLIERVLYIFDEHVVVIELDEDKGVPYLRTKGEISEALADGSAFRRTVDPYAKYARPDESFLEKHGHIRDRAWGIIGEIAEDEPAIYFPQSRGPLVRGVVEKHKKTKGEIYSLLRRYWVRGCVPNAVLPSYDRCGAPGKDRIITSEDLVNMEKAGKIPAKRGRPSKISKVDSDCSGVNVTQDIVKIFKIAIRLYFDKQKKWALQDAYGEMKRNFFNRGERVERGVVVKVMPPSHEIPTFDQFRYWHLKLQDYAESLRKRLGENKYNLTSRAILGDSTKQAPGPGSLYQIDATIADIYLVSLLDPYRIIGRPVVYFVKDVFSRMVVGLYIGLESPSWTGAMMAIANTTANKVEFCAEYGIEINPEEWPCNNLCEKFVGDGGELLSINSDALIERLKIPVANCSPYRGDLKAIVERQFGTANEKVVKWLPGAVHDFQVEQRDHRLDAKMDIHQFIRIIIVMVLEHNQCQWLDGYRLDRDMMADNVDPVPIKLWNWGLINRSGHLRERTQDVVRAALMPRGKATVTEKGIRFERMYYSCDRALREQWYVKARGKGRWEVDVSFDTRKADVIYLNNTDGTIEPCQLVDADARFKGASVEEVQDYFEVKEIKSKQHETTRIQSSARLHGMIDAELAAAKARRKETPRPEVSNSQLIKEIPENRRVDKMQAREKEAFDLRHQKQRNKPATVHPFSAENKDDPKVRTADQQQKDFLAIIKATENKDS